jgi:hypothetical protein
MGCDIHNFVEVEKDGQWTLLGDVFRDPWYQEDKPISEYNQPYTNEPYKGRNYRLFGVLANVRYDGCESIVPVRGVPSDASLLYKGIVDEWGQDGHSHSWATLKELTEYSYDTMAPITAMVSSEEYKHFKQEGVPNSWCGGIYSPHVIYLSNEQMEEYLTDPDQYVQINTLHWLNENKRKADKYLFPTANNPLEDSLREYKEGTFDFKQFSFHTELTWHESLRDFCGENWFNILKELEKFAPDGDFNRIRLVFFFDN